MENDPDERIVMTPKKKTSNSTTLKMERKRILQAQSSNGGSGKVHVAGGSNAGIIVNKEQGGDQDDQWAGIKCHLCLEFRVFLVNTATKRYTQEKRIISYWFKDLFPQQQRTTAAQDFFKTLVSPVDFPRDYVGFIKKIMKLMQMHYPMLAKVEVEMTQEKEMDQLPNRPMDEDKEKKEEVLVPEKVLAVIEEAYPNSLTIDDMSRRFKSETEVVRNMVLELVNKKLVKPVGGAGVQQEAAGLDPAAGAFRRVHQNEEEVTIVKQMPRGLEAMQPTIAVITAQYFEKMAVDAMMTNKQTFMRYATVGEANVYTLGDIGGHRVVSTKLPMSGTSSNALIATGSTTTRLLGTFQGVEHVFLVGVAGAVPHYTDFDKHVRLGDVVMSSPPLQGQRFIYQFCESVKQKGQGEIQFETKSWCPVDLGLQQIQQSLLDKMSEERPWLKHYQNGLNVLCDHEEDQTSGGLGFVDEGWLRPSAESDKLYMSMGGGDVIEVGHPTPPEGVDDPRIHGHPVLHMGPLAAGRAVALDDQLRQEYASRNGILAFDSELDAVVESIYGNRKDQYTLIRGMADYKDGTRRKDWQQYAALNAAAVLKTVINEMQ